MRKLKRRKVIKEFLEDSIAKNQRRIAALSATNFELRKKLEFLVALPVSKPLTKADLAERNKASEVTPETTQPVMDSADQEIGMPLVEEKNDVSPAILPTA